MCCIKTEYDNMLKLLLHAVMWRQKCFRDVLASVIFHRRWSDLCRRLWPHQRGTERRQLHEARASGCCECRVRCDVDQSAVRERGGRGGNFFKSPVTSPSCCPQCQSQCCLNIPSPISRGEKKKTTEKKRGWSPLLKLKFHLGKQTGFPPVVTHPRHPCHLFPACHFSPLCFWSLSYSHLWLMYKTYSAKSTAILVYKRN